MDLLNPMAIAILAGGFLLFAGLILGVLLELTNFRHRIKEETIVNLLGSIVFVTTLALAISGYMVSFLVDFGSVAATSSIIYILGIFFGRFGTRKLRGW